MLRASELTKRYGSTLALDRLSLDVPAGAVFGLLGPNGSGKSTFLKLAMGFIFPEAGQIDRGDLSTAQIGYLSEHAFYPTRFAVRDYLTTLGHLGGTVASGPAGPSGRGNLLRREIDRLLAQLGLEEFAGRRLGALSRGTLQRVGLAQVLLGNPDLILLDEPVLGLDPAAQKFMRDQIVALHLAGKTVFLCSHNLDEVTRVCTHVAVLKQGKLVHAGPLPEMLHAGPLAAGARSQVIITTGILPADLSACLAALSPGITAGDGQVTLGDEARACKAQVLRLLLDAGIDIKRLDERQVNLEEIYLQVTGPAQFPRKGTP
jgi:ABC-2 type transport system ATP-binding protein